MGASGSQAGCELATSSIWAEVERNTTEERASHERGASEACGASEARATSAGQERVASGVSGKARSSTMLAGAKQQPNKIEIDRMLQRGCARGRKRGTQM